MVLVGLDAMVSAYRELEGYPHVIDEAVLHNPDELSADELHTLTRPVAGRIVAGAQTAAVAQFEQLQGTGRAISHPTRIEDAARDGRVHTVFLATEPSCWDQLGSDGLVVQLGTDESFAHCQLLERVAVDCLTTAARIHAVPARDVPGGSDLAAILRY